MIAAPIKTTVSLQEGLKWRGGGDWTYEEKKDGVRAIFFGPGLHSWGDNLIHPVSTALGDTVLDGEWCKGAYWVFDVLKADGIPCDKLPLRDRLDILRGLTLPESFRHIPRSANGGEYLEAVLAAGGEGIVAKRLDAPYGKHWVRCKRHETHDCVVTEKHPSKMSVHLSENGQDRGWVTVLGRKAYEKISTGTIVEVICHSVHASGKLREPRFSRIRTDKAH